MTKKYILFLLLGTLSLPPGLAYSDDFVGYASVSDLELSVQRAGFVGDNGLPVQLSWTEKATVNGVTVLSKTFDELTPPSADDMKTVLQQGPGNIIAVPASNGILLTAIQNNLNNRIISHSTTIKATVATLTLIRNLNLASSLRNQLVNGIR